MAIQVHDGDGTDWVALENKRRSAEREHKRYQHMQQARRAKLEKAAEICHDIHEHDLHSNLTAIAKYSSKLLIKSCIDRLDRLIKRYESGRELFAQTRRRQTILRDAVDVLRSIERGNALPRMVDETIP